MQKMHIAFYVFRAQTVFFDFFPNFCENIVMMGKVIKNYL